MYQGFTKYYIFEFTDGKVNMRKLSNLESPEEVADENDLVKNWATARKAILTELFDLPADATFDDILHANLRLPQLPEIELKEKKLESLMRKYQYIPPEF